MKINLKKAKIWQWLDLDPVLLVVLIIILIVHYLNFFPSDLDDFVPILNSARLFNLHINPPKFSND